MGDREARRILIYAVTGSGKTTLAARLSAATGIPWHSVDDLTFKANWEPVPKEEQTKIIQTICESDSWILDSAYGSWLDIPLSRAELIVGLDYPRWFSLARLLRRTFRRVVTGELACNGNRESFRQALSNDSIIKWHFDSFARKRERIRKWEASPTGPEVRRFTSHRQLTKWLAELEAHSTAR